MKTMDNVKKQIDLLEKEVRDRFCEMLIRVIELENKLRIYQAEKEEMKYKLKDILKKLEE
jgi:hypothetical protein